MSFFEKLVRILPAVWQVITGVSQGISSWRNRPKAPLPDDITKEG